MASKLEQAEKLRWRHLMRSIRLSAFIRGWLAVEAGISKGRAFSDEFTYTGVKQWQTGYETYMQHGATWESLGKSLIEAQPSNEQEPE